MCRCIRIDESLDEVQEMKNFCAIKRDIEKSGCILLLSMHLYIKLFSYLSSELSCHIVLVLGKYQDQH